MLTNVSAAAARAASPGPVKRLRLLQRATVSGTWKSLDDLCTCLLCERSFAGGKALFRVTSGGDVEILCPTIGCSGTAGEWIHPGDALLSEKAWDDWVKLMDQAGLPRRDEPVTTRR